MINRNGLSSQQLQRLYRILIVTYVLVLFCNVVVLRTSAKTNHIVTDWFWGYHSSQHVLRDNVYNIIAFIPVGLMIGLIVPKYKILSATLVGLFISETIECSQLIWKRGTFDVDDLLNNTIGAFVGALIVVLLAWIRKLIIKHG